MSEDTLVICPFCAEEIRAKAIKCKHCHEAIPSPGDKEKPKKKSEEVLANLHPVWHTFGWELFFGILLLPIFGVGLILIIRTAIKRQSKQYILSTKKIIIREGLLTRTTQSFNLSKINSMSYSQTAMQRIMKSGNVLLALPGMKIPVENIAHPQRFVEAINKHK